MSAQYTNVNIRSYTLIARQHRNMSIQSFMPANNKTHMSTAVNSFKKCLASDSVTVGQLSASIRSDRSGACIVAVMKKSSSCTSPISRIVSYNNYEILQLSWCVEFH